MYNIKEIKNAHHIIKLGEALESVDYQSQKYRVASNQLLAQLSGCETPGIECFDTIIDGINSMILPDVITERHTDKTDKAYYQTYGKQGRQLARRWPSWSSIAARYLTYVLLHKFDSNDITGWEVLHQFFNYIHAENQRYNIVDNDSETLLRAYITWKQFVGVPPTYAEN